MPGRASLPSVSVTADRRRHFAPTTPSTHRSDGPRGHHSRSRERACISHRGARRRRSTTLRGNHADLNTASLDGCPIQSPDGHSLYLASNRPGGKGGLDIWVSTRANTGDPWGAPENLPEPINSASDDFCPTPLHGDELLFVSSGPRRESLRPGRHLLREPQPGARLERARAPRLRPRRAEQRAGRAGALVHPRAVVLLTLRPASGQHGRALRQREAGSHVLRAGDRQSPS